MSTSAMTTATAAAIAATATTAGQKQSIAVDVVRELSIVAGN